MPEATGSVSPNVLATVVTFDTDGTDIVERLPPTNWEPATATATELDFFGIPPRPSDAASLLQWNSEWVDHYSGFALGTPCGQTSMVGPDTSCPTGAACTPNWAGVVSTEGGITEAYAQTPFLPSTACSQIPTSFDQWVGIGGFNLPQLLQNGFTTTASGGGVAFFEGVDGTQGGGGMDVNLSSSYYFGDTFNIATTMITPVTVQFGWHDLTQGFVTLMDVYGIDGLPIQDYYNGGSGEAIDERPLTSSGYSTLRNFGTNYWTLAQVAQNNGTPEPIRSVPHVGVDMLENGILYAKTGPADPNPANFSVNWETCGVVG